MNIQIEIDTETIGSEIVNQIQSDINDAMLDAGCDSYYPEVIKTLKIEKHPNDKLWSTFRIISEYLKTKEVKENEIKKDIQGAASQSTALSAILEYGIAMEQMQIDLEKEGAILKKASDKDWDKPIFQVSNNFNSNYWAERNSENYTTNPIMIEIVGDKDSAQVSLISRDCEHWECEALLTIVRRAVYKKWGEKC